jgi:hypothetical protein
MDPVNLSLRFLLEISALGTLGCWGWSLTDSRWRWLAALAWVPLAVHPAWSDQRVAWLLRQ